MKRITINNIVPYSVDGLFLSKKIGGFKGLLTEDISKQMLDLSTLAERGGYFLNEDHLKINYIVDQPTIFCRVLRFTKPFDQKNPPYNKFAHVFQLKNNELLIMSKESIQFTLIFKSNELALEYYNGLIGNNKFY